MVYFAMRDWLNGFALRIDLGAGPFALAAIGVLAIALLTVGLQALRAALTNPVDSIRHE